MTKDAEQARREWEAMRNTTPEERALHGEAHRQALLYAIRNGRPPPTLSEILGLDLHRR